MFQIRRMKVCHNHLSMTISFFRGISSSSPMKHISVDGEPTLTSLLDKYFHSTPIVVLNESKDLSLQISDAISLDDLVRLDELLDVSLKTGSSEEVDRILRYHLSSGRLSVVSTLLPKCHPRSVSLSRETCFLALRETVNHCFWRPSLLLCLYISVSNLSSSHREDNKLVFFTVGALMRNSIGVCQALDLMTTISICRRTDLAGIFSFNKMTRYAQSLSSSSSSSSMIGGFPRDLIHSSLSSSLSSLRCHGWFCFSLGKALLALTMATGHMDLALWFVNESVDEALLWNKQQSQQQPVDILSMLRCFSQATGITSSTGEEKNRRRREVLESLHFHLVRLTTNHSLLMSSSSSSVGVLQAMDVCTNYWVLSYRLKNHPVPSIDKEVWIESEQRLRDLFEQLRRFASSSSLRNNKRFLELCPSSGHDRRLVRVFCDELGLRHQVRRSDVKYEQLVVKVWKPSLSSSTSSSSSSSSSSSFVNPKTIEQLLRWQDQHSLEHSLVDRLPLRWQSLHDWLFSSLDDRSLRIVSFKVINAMQKYPSVSWAMLFIDLLRDRGLPLPRGMLRSVLKMSAERGDVYGAVEVLHCCEEEQRLSIGKKEFQKKLKELFVLEEDEEEGEGDNNNNTLVDNLSVRDWNKACLVAFRGRQKGMPLESYRDVFTEVMNLMRQAEVPLDDQAMQTLLRFLIHNDSLESDVLWRLIRRLNRDKQASLGHVECIAMTHLLLQRIDPTRRLLAIARPIYSSENYLFIYPNTLDKVLDLLFGSSSSSVLGMSTLKPFEDAWIRLHSEDGRDELLEIMKKVVNPNNSHYSSLVTTESDVCRDAVALVCIYVAYLVGSHDGKFREGYELMYQVDCIYQEAMRQIQQADEEESQESYNAFNDPDGEE